MQRHVRPYYLSGTGYVQITVDIYKVQNCVTYFLIPVRLYLKILRLVFVLHVIVYLFLIITDKVSAETSSALLSYLTLIPSSLIQMSHRRLIYRITSLLRVLLDKVRQFQFTVEAGQTKICGFRSAKTLLSRIFNE